MFKNNQSFYEQVQSENYPIKRLVSRPNRTPDDVIKVLALGVLGDQWEVTQLLNKCHPGWRKTL